MKATQLIRVIFISFIACVQFSMAHAADEWPSSPIRLVIPFAPGGGVDGAGRMLAQALEEKLKVSVIVDNKAGANGTIAMNYLRQSKPDGYTLSMVSTGALDVNMALMTLPYEPAKDFTYITSFIKFPFYLSVTPESGIKSLNDLVAMAKANPGKVTYSSPGIGNGIHLAGAMLSQMTGTQMTHVPYKGAGPAAVALLANEVTFTFGSGPSILSFVDAGKVNVIATSNLNRIPNRSSFPTLNELGLKGYDCSSLGGVVGPAGMPPEITTKLYKAIDEILSNKAMQEKILTAGLVPWQVTGKQFEEAIAADRKKYGDLITAANMKNN